MIVNTRTGQKFMLQILLCAGAFINMKAIQEELNGKNIPTQESSQTAEAPTPEQQAEMIATHNEAAIKSIATMLPKPTEPISSGFSFGKPAAKQATITTNENGGISFGDPVSITKSSDGSTIEQHVDTNGSKVTLHKDAQGRMVKTVITPKPTSMMRSMTDAIGFTTPEQTVITHNVDDGTHEAVTNSKISQSIFEAPTVTTTKFNNQGVKTTTSIEHSDGSSETSIQHNKNGSSLETTTNLAVDKTNNRAPIVSTSTDVTQVDQDGNRTAIASSKQVDRYTQLPFKEPRHTESTQTITERTQDGKTKTTQTTLKNGATTGTITTVDSQGIKTVETLTQSEPLIPYINHK